MKNYSICIWSVIPNSRVANNTGCPECDRTKRYSKLAIEWMEKIMVTANIKIEHADNGGEHIIKGTRKRADGYNRETNTIYEFLGDYWHGNPEKFRREDKHEMLPKTFGELHDETFARFEFLRGLGYNIRYVWEKDYRAGRMFSG